MPIPRRRPIALAVVAACFAFALTACAPAAAPSAQLRADVSAGSAASSPAELSPQPDGSRAEAFPPEVAAGVTPDFPAVTAGDCLQDAAVPAAGYSLVPCTDAHNYEVFVSQTLTERAYPGETELDLIAAEVCETGFSDYVGGSQGEGDLSIGVFAPSEQEWLFGDRELLCVLVSPDAQGNSGSLRDSGR